MCPHRVILALEKKEETIKGASFINLINTTKRAREKERERDGGRERERERGDSKITGSWRMKANRTGWYIRTKESLNKRKTKY